MCAIFFQFTLSGITAGFQGLYPLLVQGRVCNGLCYDEVGVTKENLRGDQVCPAQNLRLEAAFQWAISALNFSSLAMGAFLDKFGPRALAQLASVLCTAGAVCTAFSVQSCTAYTIGYAILGVGGQAFTFSVLHLGNVFPDNVGLLSTVLMAAFDASACLFFGFALINQHLGFSLEVIFLTFTVIPVLHMFTLAVLQPRIPFSLSTAGAVENTAFHLDSPSPPPPTTGWGNDTGEEDAALLRNGRKTRNKRGGWCQRWFCTKYQKPTNTLAFASRSEQYRSPQFILFMGWSASMVMATYFYMGSVHDQIHWLSGNDILLARWGANLFSVLLPIVSIVSAPFLGYILDFWGPSGTWILLLCCCVCFHLFNFVVS